MFQLSSKATWKCVFSVAIICVAASVFCSDAHSDKERKVDVARHRAMAKAHTDAAVCLESGKKEDECAKVLQAACKGLAIGKYCGMKHEH